jgi:hypothetical protein
MNPLKICITYDDNFEPMCSHLCSNLRIPGIKIRLNKTESDKDYREGFRSKNWYMNLSEKIRFLSAEIDNIDQGEVICCCDADIQFFKPKELLRLKSFMESSDLEYTGQRESDKDEFNGGFFLLKKTDKILKLLDKINSDDLTKYYLAEQDMINNLILQFNIKHRFLSRIKYLHGCMRKNCYVSPNIINKIVMHHATCSFNASQKMEQMNEIRSIIGFNTIEWIKYLG